MNRKGMELGRRIVDAHGGRTGGELAMAMLARRDPELAGRAVGAAIVEAHGGKTGAELAADML